jgi:putative membrane protein
MALKSRGRYVTFSTEKQSRQLNFKNVINLLFGWLLALIAFPLMIITFGLFKFVINAFLLWITDLLVDGLEIKGAATLLIAAFLIAVIDSVLRWIF